MTRTSALAGAIGLAAIGAVAVALVLTATGTIAPDPNGGPVTLILYLLMETSFVVVGVILVTRVPDNRVGWILWTAGVALAISVVGRTVAAETYLRSGAMPAATVAMWLSLTATQVAFGLTMAFLPLLYPTGRPPSPRWRPVLWYAVVAMAFSVAKEILVPGLLDESYPVQNPIGLEVMSERWGAVESLDAILLLTLIPACALSLVARYRAGANLERQQVKWFGAIALVMVTCFALAIVAPDQDLANLGWALAVLTLPLLPIAIGVAVLRYRLYEIDRIISRTVGYVIVTGILAATFAIVIVALQGLLTPFTQGQTIAVAASTLAVFALFQPVRRRVQRAVDRRFDRGKYDADRTIQGFSSRLRDDVDLSVVRREIVHTAGSAVRPTAAGIWLRGE